jgi:hypothetical protein
MADDAQAEDLGFVAERQEFRTDGLGEGQGVAGVGVDYDGDFHIKLLVLSKKVKIFKVKIFFWGQGGSAPS